MNSQNGLVSRNDIFENLLDLRLKDGYFVSELLWDHIVINEFKLNCLTPELLTDLLKVSWSEAVANEKMTIEFIEYVLVRATSVQKIFHMKSVYRSINLTIKEKMAWIDFDIWWPDKRSPYLQKAFSQLGFESSVQTYKEKYFNIIRPKELQRWAKA